MRFIDSDSSDVLVEVANSLYVALEEAEKQIRVLGSSRFQLVKSTRWFNVYEVEDGIYFVVWKYNHLFKVLEPLTLARMYKYYPVNLDLFETQIASRGCFIGGTHN